MLLEEREEVVKQVVQHFRVPYHVGHILFAGGNLKGSPAERQLLRYKRSGEDSKGFQPYPKGGKTVVTLVTQDGKEYSGEAVCSLSDNFNYRLGLRIAYARAVKRFYGG